MSGVFPSSLPVLLPFVSSVRMSLLILSCSQGRGSGSFRSPSVDVSASRKQPGVIAATPGGRLRSALGQGSLSLAPGPCQPRTSYPGARRDGGGRGALLSRGLGSAWWPALSMPRPTRCRHRGATSAQLRSCSTCERPGRRVGQGGTWRATRSFDFVFGRRATWTGPSATAPVVTSVTKRQQRRIPRSRLRCRGGGVWHKSSWAGVHALVIDWQMPAGRSAGLVWPSDPPRHPLTGTSRSSRPTSAGRASIQAAGHRPTRLLAMLYLPQAWAVSVSGSRFLGFRAKANDSCTTGRDHGSTSSFSASDSDGISAGSMSTCWPQCGSYRHGMVRSGRAHPRGAFACSLRPSTRWTRIAGSAASGCSPRQDADSTRTAARAAGAHVRAMSGGDDRTSWLAHLSMTALEGWRECGTDQSARSCAVHPPWGRGLTLRLGRGN